MPRRAWSASEFRSATPWLSCIGDVARVECPGAVAQRLQFLRRQVAPLSGPQPLVAHRPEDLGAAVLTAAEQHLVRSLSGEKGRDLLKQVRIQLVETARPMLEAMVQEVTGAKVLSLHHDVSTTTGEEVVLFTLNDSPVFRETRKKQDNQQ